MGVDAVALDYDHRVGITGAARAVAKNARLRCGRDTVEERAALLRLDGRELQRAAALVIDDELHRAVAEVAGAVEEDHRRVVSHGALEGRAPYPTTPGSIPALALVDAGTTYVVAASTRAQGTAKKGAIYCGMSVAELESMTRAARDVPTTTHTATAGATLRVLPAQLQTLPSPPCDGAQTDVPSARPTSAPSFDADWLAAGLALGRPPLPGDLAVPKRVAGTTFDGSDLRWAFLLLHADGRSSMAEIAASAQLPLSEVRDAFLALAALGCIELNGTASTAVPPESGTFSRSLFTMADVQLRSERSRFAARRSKLK